MTPRVDATKFSCGTLIPATGKFSQLRGGPHKEGSRSEPFEDAAAARSELTVRKTRAAARTREIVKPAPNR